MVHLLLKPTLKLWLLSWAFAVGVTPALAGVMLSSNGEVVAIEQVGGGAPPADAPPRCAPTCEPASGIVEVERAGGGNSLAVLNPSSSFMEPQLRDFCVPPDGVNAGEDIPEEIFRPT